MERSRQDEAGDRHDRDFYGWTVEQAQLLRERRFKEADVAGIVEEIETLGRSEFAALRSSYRLVLLHLLKLVHQPTHAGASWTATIVRERNAIEDVLADNPGLRPRRREAFTKAYPAARREAAGETGLLLEAFPVTCPFQ